MPGHVQHVQHVQHCHFQHISEMFLKKKSNERVTDLTNCIPGMTCITGATNMSKVQLQYNVYTYIKPPACLILAG